MIGDEPANTRCDLDDRWYILRDKLRRADGLAHADQPAWADDGAPGVDQVTVKQIEAAGLKDWLTRLVEAMRPTAYRCQPVRRAMIPTAGGAIPQDGLLQSLGRRIVDPGMLRLIWQWLKAPAR